MNRYIDIESKEATHLICNLEPRWKPMAKMTIDERGVAFEELNSIAEAFLALPTADVVEVVHARWNEDGRCSNCDWYMPFNCLGEAVESEYCAVCGAKMDGERREG